MIEYNRKPHLIAVHCSSGEGMDDRFDTLSIPNGSIAVLSYVAQTLGITSCVFDEAFLGHNNDVKIDSLQRLTALISAEVEASLRRNEKPFVLCTVLNYNAEKSLYLLNRIKRQFGAKVHTGVGGQHIRTCEAAYLAKLTAISGGYLDHIAVGDAEVLLPRIFHGETYVKGYLAIGGRNHYSQPSYDNYFAIRERLDEMKRTSLGPFELGSSQLVMESVRGCAWAYNQKAACSMCALENIDNAPVYKPFDQHFQIITELVEKFGVNWLFDVSNQWLPVLNTQRAVDWLEGYLAAKESSRAPNVNLYTYLTSNSLNPRTVPLLRKAGIKMAYVGIDGWENKTQKALGKARLTLNKKRRGLRIVGSSSDDIVDSGRTIDSVLGLCRDNGLFIRTSLVIGSGLDRDNLIELPEFVGTLTQGFGDVVLTLGTFRQIILPGSPLFSSFQERARSQHWGDVEELFNLFYKQGYLNWEQQTHLDRLFIFYDQKRRVEEGSLEAGKAVSFEEVEDAIRKAREAALKDGRVIITSIEDGGTGGHLQKKSEESAKIALTAV